MAITSADLLTPDSYIEEISEWVDRIYEITEEDYVHGGEHGFSNVPHEQLSNRTLYLKDELSALSSFVDSIRQDVENHKNDNLTDISELRASLTSLTESLRTLEEKVVGDEQHDNNEFSTLLDKIDSLQYAFEHRNYNFAASATEGGPATSVDARKVFTTKISLVGVDEVDQTKLKYNTSVTIDQSTLQATTFKGSLDGEAKTAKKLTDKVNVTLFGDVTGTAKFDGSDDLKINAVITPNEDGSVPTGTYGPGMDLVVKPGEVFYVPEFSVSRSGLITKIANREVQITLDSDIVNKTINNEPTNDKILLVGTLNQGTKQQTYSNEAVFEKNGKLYSQFNEVIDSASEQSMTNKTINGIYIKESAGRDIETEINGVAGSDKLVTSDSLARHTHQYAESDEEGRATKLFIGDNSFKDGKLITSTDDKTIGVNENVRVRSGNLTAKGLEAKKINATEELKIPGGKLWIEEVTGEGTLGYTPQIENLISELNEMKRIIAGLDTDTMHTGKVFYEQTCEPMQLLTYNSGYYRLADNRNKILCSNLVLALTTSDVNHNVTVLTSGTYLMPDNTYDGCTCYVGQNGNILFDRPEDEDLILKKVGFVVENKFVFRPEGTDVDYVHDIKNKTWEFDAEKNLMPVTSLRAHDALWEYDVFGDCMPCRGTDFDNDLWENTDDGELTPLDIINPSVDVVNP